MAGVTKLLKEMDDKIESNMKGQHEINPKLWEPIVYFSPFLK